MKWFAAVLPLLLGSLSVSAQEAGWQMITGTVIKCKSGDSRFYYVKDDAGAEWVANAKHPGPRESEELFKEAYNTAQKLKIEFLSYPDKPGSIWKIRSIELLPVQNGSGTVLTNENLLVGSIGNNPV